MEDQDTEAELEPYDEIVEDNDNYSTLSWSRSAASPINSQHTKASPVVAIPTKNKFLFYQYYTVARPETRAS